MSTDTEDRPAQGHVILLCFCVVALAAAVLLGHLAAVDGVLVIGGQAVPELCTVRRVTGLPCAGCGLTRSWVALAQGDLGLSLHHNRVGWLLMLYVVAQAVRHGTWLARRGWRDAVERGGRWLDRGLLGLVVVLLVNWVVTLIGLRLARVY